MPDHGPTGDPHKVRTPKPKGTNVGPAKKKRKPNAVKPPAPRVNKSPQKRA